MPDRSPPVPKALAPDPALLARAVLDRRWTVLARTGVDLASVATWDRRLDRRTRILVPCDVQAFVAPKTGGEAVVPLTGAPGDPAPFAAGAPRAPGVHLHWAMPDALLRGRQSRAPDGTLHAPADQSLALPRLPDRWVVVRALFPAGAAQALVRGWVLDAPTGAVTPLATYAGTPAPPPPGTPVYDPLDGARGGSLLWTASYAASAGRFAFHDPLGDLPAAGVGAEGAAYVVAGWWTDLAADPLGAAAGPARLDAVLAELGWHVTHDAADALQQSEDPNVVRLRKAMGLPSPDPEPPATVVTAEGKAVARSIGRAALGVAVPVEKAERVLVGPALPRYASLVHGAVLGVPVLGAVPAGADDRPAPGAARAALGLDVDDVVAAFGAPVFGAGAAGRAAAERLTAAFTGGLLDRLGSPDGLADLAEREHADGFASLPGTPLAGARTDRLRAEDSAAVGPTTVGRRGRGAAAAAARELDGTRVSLGWRRGVDLRGSKQTGKAAGAQGDFKRSPTVGEATEEARKGSRAAAPEAREVVRPAPRWFRPQAPLLAVRGAHPNHRHHGDGLYDDQGLLRCRYPRECVTAWRGVVTGGAVVPSLGSGAVPAEVLTVVREAVLLDPYARGWLAAVAAAASGADRRPAFEARLTAEMVRLYGAEGRYDGVTRLTTPAAPTPRGRGARAAAAPDPWVAVTAERAPTLRAVTAVLAAHSLQEGAPPSPVAITTWRQPWVPLWAEWRVTLAGAAGLDGWTLGALDLERPGGAEPPPARTLTFAGRSPLGQGVSRALQQGIQQWLDAELQRDNSGDRTLTPADDAALRNLANFVGPLDLVSTSLDGVRERLLGVPYVDRLPLGTPGPGGQERGLADALPAPLFGGTLRLDALRLVDAFGRTLDVPVAEVATTTTLEVAGLPNGVRLRPRVQHLARWLLRLVDPAHPPALDPALAPEAFVDQLRPQLAVNPVAGFLLPDHIDEALEAFDVAGAPLGQLAHDPVTGAVTWEPAPGRPLPPDAGPLAGLDAHTALVGELAAGVVVADVAARATATPPDASALTALLRAVDTTLWTVDTFAAVGSPTVAGLVGRPIAVVRATLRLDAPDDLAEVDAAAAGGPDARRAAFDALRDQRFPVRLGALDRSDDALLGFFVDDDYGRLRLVDRVVAALARAGGRHRGQLGLLGSTVVPPVDPLDHPYLADDDVVFVRPGQTVQLTLLMLPAGSVHLTSGVLPRKALALGHDWVGPGLAAMQPSVRVGPLLVDPSEIRLPLVHALGDRQTFTRRTGPLTWRDDPIVAATQAALLPRLPHEVQEGWIRVTPRDTTDGATPATPPAGGGAP